MDKSNPMNTEPRWVACLDTASASALSALRLLPELEIALLGTAVWLRGPAWHDALALALRKVPGLRRFSVAGDGQLFADGARVPEGWLPELRWQPLRSARPVMLPAAPAASGTPAVSPLRLVRSTHELPAQAVLADIGAWRAWAGDAPEIRLRPLRFAAARDGRVWIEGTPLPALAGQRFHVRDGVAVPCGFVCEPDLETRVLRRWLALAEDDTAFAQPDGTWEIVKAEQFVPALRSAVRRTAEGLGYA